jgi:hypothetical protein
MTLYIITNFPLPGKLNILLPAIRGEGYFEKLAIGSGKFTGILCRILNSRMKF